MREGKMELKEKEEENEGRCFNILCEYRGSQTCFSNERIGFKCDCGGYIWHKSAYTEVCRDELTEHFMEYTEEEIRDLIKFAFDKWDDEDIEGRSELFDETYPTVAVWINGEEYGVDCGDFKGVDEIFFFIDNARFDDLILSKKEVNNA